MLVKKEVKEIIYKTYMNNHKRNTPISIFIFLFGVFLHQAMVTPLGNLSIADFILIIFGIYILISKKIVLTKVHIIFTLFFFIYIFITTAFLSPFFFNITLDSSFIGGISKLIVLFLYFFVGNCLAKNYGVDRLIFVYSNVAVVIGVIGIIHSIFPIPFFNDIFFVFGTRFNGFMNDPNYFAVLQVTAIPYFVKNISSKKTSSFFSIAILIFSILLSGSKTGVLTLGVYFLFLIIQNLFFRDVKISQKKIIRDVIIIGIILLGVIIIVENFEPILSWINLKFPSTTRITTLFTDFESAISSEGSTRDLAWENGIKIIKASPLFGVGIADYSKISSKYLGSGVVAHNTYIQLAAEWGLPLMLLFFSGIFILIINIMLSKKNVVSLNILKDIIIIFLIGSMGISLNNARFFWLILGSILTGFKYNRRSYAK